MVPCPDAQAIINSAALFAAVSGPFMIAALTKRNAHTGWRLFYVSPGPRIYVLKRSEADL